MRVELGALESLPRDRGILVTVGDTRVAVFRVADEVLAVGDRCSHAEASLAKGEVYGTDVECPRHGSEFDLRTGAALSLPATQPVPVYEVTIEDGNVYLVLEDS